MCQVLFIMHPVCVVFTPLVVSPLIMSSSRNVRTVAWPDTSPATLATLAPNLVCKHYTRAAHPPSLPASSQRQIRDRVILLYFMIVPSVLLLPIACSVTVWILKNIMIDNKYGFIRFIRYVHMKQKLCICPLATIQSVSKAGASALLQSSLLLPSLLLCGSTH